MTKTKPPRHVAIVADGNRRWAQAMRRDKRDGFGPAVANMIEVLLAAADAQIEALTVYAMSTENRSRTKEEIDYLWSRFPIACEQVTAAMNQHNIRLRFLGRRNDIPDTVREAIDKAEHSTAHNTRLIAYIAWNYGGQDEIVDAAKKLIDSGIEADEVSKEVFTSHLYEPQLGQVDFLIRTGGEARLSNFMLWQVAYAELYFTDVLWPEFGSSELLKALQYYATRDRRYGL